MCESTTPPTTTLWIWPTGLFPRRVLYYFRAKGITLSVLQQNNIHLVPVILENYQLVSMSDFEARPADTSLPVCRIERANAKTVWIHESIAILEYLEEKFPSSEGYPNLIGSSIEQRARTRDILSLTNDAFVWSGVELIHTNPATTMWSGLTVDGMSSTAASQAGAKVCMLFERLEKWVRESVTDKRCKSLAGEGASVTLADVMLMAQVEYFNMSDGPVLVADYSVLKLWHDKAKLEAWYVGNDVLRTVETAGSWEIVLGV